MSVEESGTRSEVVLQGISASQGIAYGQIFVYIQSDVEVPEYKVEKARHAAEVTRFEQALSTKVHRSPTDVGLSLDPATGRHLMEELNRKIAHLTASGAPAVIVVSTENRLPVRRFLEPSFPRLTVLAYQELPSATEIENAGIIPAPAHLLRQEPAPVKAAA